MAYAATLRGARAASPAPTTIVAPAGWAVVRALAAAIVDSRRRRALREIRRHQPYGPLASRRHIGLTCSELLPF